ncbi:MAG: EamA family transporter [Elusimicrobiota bacterium]
MKEVAKAYWALAAVCLFWGMTYIAIRIGVRDTPPFLFASTRFLLAGCALLGYALVRGQKLPKGREWFDLAVIAFLLLGMGNGILTWAEQWVPAGIASLIIAFIPFWMVGFARLSGETVTRRAVGGLAIGLLGLAVLVWPDLRMSGLDSGFARGAGMLLFGSAAWSFGSVYAKWRQPRTGPVMTIALQQFVGGSFLGAVGLFRGEWAMWDPSAASWAALLFLVVFGSIVGYSCYIYSLEKLPTERVAIYAYANPVVAVALGVLLLGERLDAYMLLGTPLVLAGIYIVNTARRAQREAVVP